MSCEDCGRNLPLYLYGELSFDEEESVERHLEECMECRAAETELAAVHRAVDGERMEPSLELLSQCRQSLKAATVRDVEVWWRRWLPVGDFGWKLAGGVALLAIGFMGARLMETPARVTVANVSVSDEILLAAARDSVDPSVRMDSMELLAKKGGRREVRDLLLRTMESDANDGVRMKAMDGLRAYADQREVRAALSRVLLQDPNATLRTQAVALLTAGDAQDSDVAGVLQELMQREENGYIRQQGQKALKAMNASVETF